MAKAKTAKQYEAELRRMIKARTCADCEPWLAPQIRTTAMNMVMLDKIQDGLCNSKKDIADWFDGSTGQMKFEAHPLLPHYDKLQRTLLMQFEALGLNYSTTPSKVKEDTKKGVDSEKDGLSNLLTQARDTMNEIPEME